MNIQYEKLSEKGSKRSINQDRIMARVSGNAALFAVADGMGGHSQGEYASEKIINSLDEWWNNFFKKSNRFQDTVNSVISALENANSEIFEYASKQHITCGSTVSVLLICDDLYAVINVGDSPVFFVTQKQECHASTEHSYDSMLKKSMEKTAYEIDDRRKGRLVQALGVKNKVYPSVRTGVIDKSHVFLLCSDGISRYFKDKQIFKYLKQVYHLKISVTDLCGFFKEKAYELGAVDNLSEIVVYVSSTRFDINSEHKKVFSIVAAIAVILLLWAIVSIIQLM